MLRTLLDFFFVLFRVTVLFINVYLCFLRPKCLTSELEQVASNDEYTLTRYERPSADTENLKDNARRRNYGDDEDVDESEDIETEQDEENGEEEDFDISETWNTE